MLVYRFTAFYNDGSQYVQNDADVSVTDPTRSCYYDVDQGRLAFFMLYGGGHYYGVDLRDGHFEINGVAFRMHEGDAADFRLIYFRRHTHHFTIGLDEVGHDTVYRLGWQATGPDGSNVQRVMELD